MEHPVEYGVFKVGQFWRVTDGNGGDMLVATREMAMKAVSQLACARRACGLAAHVIIQDETGRLVRAREPDDVPRRDGSP